MTRPSAPIQIAAFYHFQPIEAARLETLARELEKLGEDRGLKGLVIMATEGVNGTVSARTTAEVESYLAAVSDYLGFPKLDSRTSQSATWPFRKFKIRLRDEIVTLGKPEVQPLSPKSPTHLSPEEWHRMMEEEGVVVLDTRNWYETRIGKFKGAIEPGLEEFQEFGGYLEKSGIEKTAKVMIYCTGGIRCEKAIVEMHNHGYENVFQLDGGILGYLAKFPEGNFDGECFVFDQRVAVDGHLRPSTHYKMCPHCGQPADQKLDCVRCESEAIVCVKCVEDEASRTCSKNCAHHYKLAPGKKGRPQRQGFRFSAGKHAP